MQLYTGDLTPGWYDEWIVPERERLRQTYLDALEQLARLLEHAGRLRDALGYAQQLQRADPLHEAAYRQLMQLHLSMDDRASALRVYHTGATTLRNELGVDPSSATQALYLHILTSDDDRREWGWVGGFPQTNLFRAWAPRLAPNLWMVGDSIFPGQSTAAVALGGLRVARALLAEYGLSDRSAAAPLATRPSPLYSN